MIGQRIYFPAVNYSHGYVVVQLLSVVGIFICFCIFLQFSLISTALCLKVGRAGVLD